MRAEGGKWARLTNATVPYGIYPAFAETLRFFVEQGPRKRKPPS
jgi:hypothetical protein